ncbi:MAG: hypothetical protein ACK5LP_06180, partial [Campylobacteraceae bacterium]
TIINIHDIVLAKQFTKRIVGLNGGSIVFDGKPEELDEKVLTKIYGSEDWNQINKDDAKEKVIEKAA